jgi:hypothetical protein
MLQCCRWWHGTQPVSNDDPSQVLQCQTACLLPQMSNASERSQLISAEAAIRVERFSDADVVSTNNTPKKAHAAVIDCEE